jgi:hypothetical protein
MNCKCANPRLSQRRGSPQLTVPNFVPTFGKKQLQMILFAKM